MSSPSKTGLPQVIIDPETTIAPPPNALEVWLAEQSRKKTEWLKRLAEIESITVELLRHVDLADEDSLGRLNAHLNKHEGLLVEMELARWIGNRRADYTLCVNCCPDPQVRTFVDEELTHRLLYLGQLHAEGELTIWHIFLDEEHSLWMVSEIYPPTDRSGEFFDDDADVLLVLYGDPDDMFMILTHSKERPVTVWATKLGTVDLLEVSPRPNPNDRVLVKEPKQGQLYHSIPAEAASTASSSTSSSCG